MIQAWGILQCQKIRKEKKEEGKERKERREDREGERERKPASCLCDCLDMRAAE